MVDIRPIKDDVSYEQALERINVLMDAEAGTPESDELDILVTLVTAFEEKEYPMDTPDPIEAIKLHMELTGLERSDFVLIVGQSRATELLKKQRKLSIDHIRAISDQWHIPINALVADYELAKSV